MWKFLMICLLAGVTSCAGSKIDSDKSEGADASNEKVAVASIRGQWLIENVVENDSSYVRPSEIAPGAPAYVDFKGDDTFGIMTNCNHLGGRYVQVDDSIRLTDISTTEMACDEMALEEMLKKVLPVVNSIDCINDSVTRLNSDKGDTYIVLKKPHGDVVK